MLLWYANTAQGEPGRRKIIGRVRGCRGNAVATASLSGQPRIHAKFGLPIPEFKHAELPSCCRFNIDGESEEEFSVRMAAESEELTLSEDPETIAAFFAEPAISGGALIPSEGHRREMQAVPRKCDVAFVADEAVCGFGRTGNMQGLETRGLEPGTMSCAKALSAACSAGLN